MAVTLRKRLLIIIILGCVLIVTGIVLIPVINYVVKIEIQKAVIIREDSMMFSIWRDLPLPIYLQFYIFDVVNPQEVLAGRKPYVKQKGPYTYREVRTKFNITFNSNGTVTYRQNRTFYFLRDMSVGDESDTFVTPNPVFWAVQWEKPEIKKVLNPLLEIMEQRAFMKRSIGELIWGYRDSSLTLAKSMAPDWYYADFIGYFVNINYTDDGVYTIFTGENDITKLGTIDKYNGSSSLNFWTTEWANQINGTDGTLMAPYSIDKSTEVYAFASDICRSAKGQYVADVEGPGGIPLWRFSAPYRYMANATVNPDNIGYCTPQSNCLDTGIMNASSCRTFDFFHIPAALSFPHFYLASDRYKTSVYGLNPNTEEHQTIIDADPYTGWVFRAAKKLQVNLYMKHYDFFEATGNITPVFMPVFWINESAVIDPPHLDMLKSKLFVPLSIILAVEITFICIGALLVLSGILYTLYYIRKVDPNFTLFRNDHHMKKLEEETKVKG